MPDPKATNAEPSEAPPSEAHLNGLLWEARADTGEITELGGEAHAILGSYADLGRPRLSVDMFHADDRHRVSAVVAQVLSTGEPAVFDARIIGAGREPLWVRNAIRTVQHDSGLHVRGVSFDITDLKRAQTEFLRARARLSFLAAVSRHLAESLDYETTLANVAKSAVPDVADWCAVRIVASDGTMEWLADVHSDPSREKILKEMTERFPPTEDFGPRKVIREGKAEFMPATAGYADIVGANPEHRDLLRNIGFTSYICVPMRGRERILGVISMAITDSGRRFTEADLELAEVLAARATMAIENARLYREARDELQRREIFIAQLGHELRNPLSAIANAVAVLDSGSLNTDRAVRLRDILKRQTSQLSRLVNDLLDISRITQGKISLRRKSLNLSELVARCVQISKETDGAGEGRNIILRVEAGDSIIDADEVRVEQIFWNLLTNAVKFTEPDGRIDVAVSRDGDDAILSVIDDGAGISPEQLPHIFKPFRQGAIGSVEAGGMGLGLALVDQMTRLHGGSVSVFSAGLGHGSRFEVRLPLAQTMAARDQANLQGGPAEKKRVLIIDDNPDVLESLRMLLESVGHEIEVASDGRSGIERVLSWHPQVALVDIGLPDMDGYQLATRLRGMNLTTPPFLVALTGYGQPEDRRRALASGFDLHLTKPVDVDELTRVLNWEDHA